MHRLRHLQLGQCPEDSQRALCKVETWRKERTSSSLENVKEGLDELRYDLAYELLIIFNYELLKYNDIK